MSSDHHFISQEDQFRFKKAARIAAAKAPFEEKVEKLIQLQKISSELARQAGRLPKEPWRIQISTDDTAI